ncbi:MAG: ABC transporter ATP-binding protein [Christensenellaceae bacterium]|jgi:putative ABC transport system ATP-binding protein
MQNPVLQCRNLTKIYRVGNNRVVALQDVDLDIYPGEFVCIVGTSGSGKSTLLYLLAGIETPTKGQIRVLDKRIDTMSEGELVKFRLQNVGFIFQSFNLLPYQSALENVAMPLMLKGKTKLERTRMAAAALKQVGLGARFKHKPSQLSGGQQQRVSIARAMVGNPKIIFADEPTGNLDSQNSEEIITLLEEEREKYGTTLIMVTHDIDNAKYADRVIHIKDGEIDEIISREAIHEEV